MVEGLKIRPGVEGDQKYLIKWLQDPDILRWFPMYNLLEIEDAAKIWVSYAKQNALLTAELDGETCGIANFYLQPFQKMKHHALLAIVVDKEHRGKGIGTKMMKELLVLGKEKLGIEIAHLEVYDGNPAKALYEKLGFTEYGYQKHFIKDRGKYLGKYYMQKRL